MHIETLTAISGMAIGVAVFSGPGARTVKAWGEQRGVGLVELYEELLTVAAVSARMADELAQCEQFRASGLPGAFAMEVDQPLGYAIVELIEGDGGLDALFSPRVLRVLGELALAFVSRAGAPSAATRHIVWKWTGYPANDPVDAGAVPAVG